MMRFSTLVRQPAAWMLPEGPHADIVISTRIRLARNLASRPFPGWAKKEERLASLAELQEELDRGLVAIIADASGFHGLITRVDLLNHLRRTLA